MSETREQKRPTEDRKPVPKPPGPDPKDKPARDTRENPAPNPGDPSELRPGKQQ
jgi:hypothetical protein